MLGLISAASAEADCSRVANRRTAVRIKPRFIGDILGIRGFAIFVVAR